MPMIDIGRSLLALRPLKIRAWQRLLSLMSLLQANFMAEMSLHRFSPK
jgi:hypothetical protein